MQPHSVESEDIYRRSHTPIAQADIIDDGKTVRQLVLHGGSVTGDRQAANRTSFEVNVVVGPDDADIDYEDLLFGKRIQIMRGALDQVASVDTRAAFYGTTTSWIPNGTSTGVMNGVKVFGDGSIGLGP